MTAIAMKSKGSLDQNSLLSINHTKVQSPLNAQNILTLNNQGSPAAQSTIRPHNQGSPAAQSTIRPHNQAHTDTPPAAARAVHPAHSTPAPAGKPLPAFTKPVQKGQKIPIESGGPLTSIRACFEWETADPRCDVDVSAFLLGADGRVPGDSWFVFYGQTLSPDRSTRFQENPAACREIISIDFTKLDPAVQKIVFVLTINDAFAKKLNFSMIKNAYMQILDHRNIELASFQMTDYYSNVISMMIGELYLYNGKWKFHAVGNGAAKDLAGLCGMYGVQVNG